MSPKSKPPSQPQKLVQKKPITVQPNPPKSAPLVQEVVQVLPVVTIPVKEEVYVPSKNAEKYPEQEKLKIQYKILAYKNDYIRLQDDVSKHLNEGWKLVGGVSASMNVSQYESVTVFSQAIIKE
jgi:hypothetical protein